MVIFGIEQLPRPKGEGFLYYKLDPSGREFLIDYLNLYHISDEELRILFATAVQHARDALVKNGRARYVLQKLYRTENMSEWADELLKEVIEEYW